MYATYYTASGSGRYCLFYGARVIENAQPITVVHTKEITRAFALLLISDFGGQDSVRFGSVLVDFLFLVPFILVGFRFFPCISTLVGFYFRYDKRCRRDDRTTR